MLVTRCFPPIKSTLFKSLEMSTVQTSNFRYFMLFVSFGTSSSSARPVAEQEENSWVEKWWHNHPQGCGKSWPSFWLSACRRGPKWGQNSTVLYCSVGYGSVTCSAHPLFSHRHHSNTGSSPDGPGRQAWKTSLQLCDNLGSVWHEGPIGRSPQSPLRYSCAQGQTALWVGPRSDCQKWYFS